MKPAESHIWTDVSRRYWNPDIETMSPERLRELQEAKLRHQVRYVYEHTAFYRNKLDAAGLTPEDIRALEDRRKLPFTTKDELRKSQEEAPPFGSYLGAPLDQVLTVQSTTGTTGRPLYIPLTRRDLGGWNECGARMYWSLGVRPGDLIVNAFALSMFSAGVPYCQMFQHMGATSIPVGAEGGATRVLRVIRELRPTVLSCTPSFAEALAEKALEVLGADAKELGIRILCGGGEAGYEVRSIRQRIEEMWGTRHVYDLAGLSEVSPMQWANCEVREGKHGMALDYVVPELVDPESGEPVEIVNGAEGELVYTSIDREAGGLLRYRSRDRVRVWTDPCPCGRTSMRVTYHGRTDDMLIVRGINVFPSAIRSVVAEFHPKVTGHMRIMLDSPGPRVDPPVRVRAEHSSEIRREELDGLQKAIEEALRSKLQFRASVDLVPPGTLERAVLKTKLVEIRTAP